MLPKRKLTFVLPYLSKISLNLRTRLRRTIESILPYCKLKVIFRSNSILNTCFDLNSLEKKIHYGKIYQYICVVTTRLLTTKKPSSTVIPEQLNIWRSLILQKNLSKTLKSLQYLTIYLNVINFDDFSI